MVKRIFFLFRFFISQQIHKTDEMERLGMAMGTNLPHLKFQVVHSQQLIIASLGLILSIAVFNWSGVSVTSYLNATSRMIIGMIIDRDFLN